MLRLACRCAECREEMTGRPRLDPASVPEDIYDLRVGLVGQYGIRIDWSDGHNTGIYTYEQLLAMCPCERCRQSRADAGGTEDRKSTRLNSSHSQISYAVFCLKKKKY